MDGPLGVITGLGLVTRDFAASSPDSRGSLALAVDDGEIRPRCNTTVSAR